MSAVVELLAWLGIALWGGRFAWLVCSPLVSRAGRAELGDRRVDSDVRAPVAPPSKSGQAPERPVTPIPSGVDPVRQHFGPELTAADPGQEPREGQLVVVTRPVRLNAAGGRPDAPVLVLRSR